MTDDSITFQIGAYECTVEYRHAIATEPIIDNIWFSPELDPNDVTFTKDVTILESDTMSTFTTKHYQNIKVLGYYLGDEINSRL